jgi:hypothetical protein
MRDRIPPPQKTSLGQCGITNNVFLSLGGDDVLGSFENEGGGEASRVAVGKDVAGVSRVNSFLLDSQSERDIGLFTLGTVIVDYLGNESLLNLLFQGSFNRLRKLVRRKTVLQRGLIELSMERWTMLRKSSRIQNSMRNSPKSPINYTLSDTTCGKFPRNPRKEKLTANPMCRVRNALSARLWKLKDYEVLMVENTLSICIN